MSDIVERIDRRVALIVRWDRASSPELRRALEFEALNAAADLSDCKAEILRLQAKTKAQGEEVRITRENDEAKDSEIERLRAAAQSAWQPIETAPTDGTNVMIAEDHRESRGEAYYDAEECRWYLANTGRGDYPDPHEPFPTHWMPLPAGPAMSSTHRNEDQP